MGRPRKYPPVDGDPTELAPEPPERLEPEEVAAEAIANPFRPLSPETVTVLNQMWRDNVQNDDDESKRFTRQIVARLRRASHPEIHPGCTRVTIDVPMLPNRQYVRINEKAYYGTVEVWECEARTILELVVHSRRVEMARLSDRGGADIDLDSPLAERVRAIQRA